MVVVCYLMVILVVFDLSVWLYFLKIGSFFFILFKWNDKSMNSFVIIINSRFVLIFYGINEDFAYVFKYENLD